MKYYLQSGDWPFNEQPYHDMMKRLGYSQGELHTSDFLLLPGGADLGARPNRDTAEIVAYQYFRVDQLPVIGICRGMQLMLYLNGAQLIEHLPDISEDLLHMTVTDHWTGESSWHLTEAGIVTNSRHHQGFMSIPQDWSVIDKTRDGIIEAVKRDNEFGVQWHPELPEMCGTSAFDWFVYQLEKTLK
jgi:putative glutamine amidotransferase